jgi:hypothetical protein
MKGGITKSIRKWPIISNKLRWQLEKIRDRAALINRIVLIGGALGPNSCVSTFKGYRNFVKEKSFPEKECSMDKDPSLLMSSIEARIEMGFDSSSIKKLGKKAKLLGFLELKDLACILAEEKNYAQEVLPYLLDLFECSSNQLDKIGESIEARFQCWLNLIYRWTCLDDNTVENSPPINYLVAYRKISGKLFECQENPHSDKIYVTVKDVKNYLKNIWAALEIQLPLPRSLFPQPPFKFPKPNILRRDSLPLREDKVSEPVPHGNHFRKKGEFWEIDFEGTHYHLKDSRGLKYIHLLLSNPNEPLSVLQMLKSVTLPNRLDNFNQKDAIELVGGENLRITEDRYCGNILDKRAIISNLSRINEIDEELKGNNNPECQVELEEEKRDLAKQLRGNRFTQVNKDIERVRQAVKKAISNAIKNIRKEDPNLGKHLFKTIKTGVNCIYHPLTDTPPWNL